MKRKGKEKEVMFKYTECSNKLIRNLITTGFKIANTII